MQLDEVIWKDVFVDKLETKHGVNTDEVEQVLFSKPHVRRVQKGRVKGEDLYVAYGQTNEGRYLVVFFVRKYQTAALPISARDMTRSERSLDPIPDEFASYEEAAAFWDTHDTTDYPDSFETVAVQAELKRRRFEIELDEDLMKVLSVQAHDRGVAVSRLVNEMLREKMHV